jgi:mannose-1-phosphate guanylyltransferase/mannose-1-phosphate guanylyltransferase/mannose-6-phosphate isomerase
MIPVVMSGGSGTRLWPVSRQSLPKQFCELFESSLFEKTMRRLQPLGSPWAITTKELKVLTDRALRELGIPLEQAIYEPMGRNTAPCIALVCHVLASRGLTDEVVGIFPADHLIENEEAFHQVVRAAEAWARDGHVVTLGIQPNLPATGYGYIETSESLSTRAGLEARKAVRFREKPDQATAQSFLDRGGFFWNSGMFIFKVETMITLFREHAPEIWNVVNQIKPDLSNIEALYATVKNISVDYAIMERLPSHVCIPGDFAWSDVGSWDAIAEIFERGGKKEQPVFSVGAEKNFVVPSPEKVYAFVGVDDLVVVDTTDALLITRRGASEKVKDVVDQLKARSDQRGFKHNFEIRPWGQFQVLRDTERFKSKVIVVDQGAQISYQSHAKRAEHWIIVRGEGEVVLDDKVIPVKYGSHVEIPVGAKHLVRNTGSEPIEFVEVQLGTYFGEDDIVRYSDVYGRV